MSCSTEFWVIAAVASWVVFAGTWMLARHQTKKRTRLDTVVSGRRKVAEGGETGGTYHLVYFKDSTDTKQSATVSRRVWKSAEQGDPITVYQKEGQREGYAHPSRPLRTANVPTLIVLFVSFLGALFLPIVAAMAVTGSQFPGCA